MTLWIPLLVVAASLLLAAALVRRGAKRDSPDEGLTALLLAVPDLVFVADREGTYLEWHAPSTDDYGVRAQEVLGRNLRDVLPGDVERLLRMCIQEALQTPRTVVQGYSLAVGGELRRFEARMVRYRNDQVICVVRDRTDSLLNVQTPEAPRLPDEPATGASRDSIWDYDLESGALTVGPMVEQWLGGGGKPLPRSFQAWLERVHPADRERLLALQSGTSPAAGPPEPGSGGTLLPDIEYRLIDQNGSIQRVRHRSRRIPGTDGSPPHIVGTVTEITSSTFPPDDSEDVRALLRRVVDAHEDERRRVARELHDDLNQRVAELHMRSTVLHSHLNEAWPKMEAQVAELFRTTTDLAEAVQSVVRMLHPVVLDEAGLAPALWALAEQIHREGVEVRVNAPPDAGDVSPAAALCLYRVAQEALRNVVRHAGSAEAEVSLRKLETMIELRVRDGGVGLDPSLAKSSGGLGLTIMRERVAALGGTFELNSRPGEGAEVVACVPRRSA